MVTNHISANRRPFKPAPGKKQAKQRVLPSFVGARTIAWVAASLLLMALLYLAQESNAALIARNLRTNQLQLTELQRENSELRFEIASMAAPSSILERAQRLGLKPATPDHVIYLDTPTLVVDKAVVMPSFAPYESHGTEAADVSAPSAWDQVLGWFGFGNATGLVQAQTR